jgi:hypothetical protein
MSNFPGYKTKTFSASQKFFVLDPNTGSPAFVQGSDLVAQITPNSNYVYAESTRTTAQATDYPLGSVIQTGGATAVGDNLAGVYLVVPSGEGDFPMDNGNELLVLAGDDTLREQLAENTSGDGSDLIAHTGTSDTVTEALDKLNTAVDKRTIFVGSVAEIEALTGVDGYQVSLSGVRAGVFKFDSSGQSAGVTADPEQAWFIAPSSDPTGASGAWIRQNEDYVKLRFFDGVAFDDAWPAANSLANYLGIPLRASGSYETTSGIEVTATDIIYEDFTVTAGGGFSGTEVILQSATGKYSGKLTVDSSDFDVHGILWTGKDCESDNLHIKSINSGSLQASGNFTVYFDNITTNSLMHIGSISIIGGTGDSDSVRNTSTPNLHIDSIFGNQIPYRLYACGGAAVEKCTVGVIISTSGSSGLYTNNVRGLHVNYVYVRCETAGVKFSRGSQNVSVDYIDAEVTVSGGDNALRLQGAKNCKVNGGRVVTASTGTSAEAVFITPHVTTLDD